MESENETNIQETIDMIFDNISNVSLKQFIAELETPSDIEYFVKTRKERLPSVQSQIKDNLEQELGCFY